MAAINEPTTQTVTIPQCLVTRGPALARDKCCKNCTDMLRRVYRSLNNLKNED